MFETVKTFIHQGKQFIPDPTKSVLPANFPGYPLIKNKACPETCYLCQNLCPTKAITIHPVTLNMGACIFCRECETACPEAKFEFTNNYRLCSNAPEKLIIRENDNFATLMNPEMIRKEVVKILGRSLKLRLVSAGSCNACEWELNASGNVNFDMGRWGIEFVASPRHADGIVVTGAVVENSLEAISRTYQAIPSPKIFILAGACAISGGLFAESPAARRDFLNNYKPDLYIPGCPPHPLTIINGIYEWMKSGRANASK